MAKTDIGKLKFSDTYPLYVQKAERKGRSKAEIDTVITWLTGFDPVGVEDQTARGKRMDSILRG